MGQLRDRMGQDLKLKGVSPATIRNYLLYCRKFAAFYMRSPQELVGASVLRAGLILVLGFEVWQLIVYDTLLIAVTMLHHANVSLGRYDNQNRPCQLSGAGITNPPTSRAVAIFFAAGRNGDRLGSGS